MKCPSLLKEVSGFFKIIMSLKSYVIVSFFIVFVFLNYFAFQSNSFAQITIPKTAEPSRIHNRFKPFPEPQSKLSPLIPSKLEQVPIKELKKVKFLLSGILIEGSTVYNDSELLPLYKEYLGTETDLAIIHEIAVRITNKYHDDGYTLSKAIVENQEVKNGIVKIKALEVYNDKIENETETNSR